MGIQIQPPGGLAQLVPQSSSTGEGQATAPAAGAAIATNTPATANLFQLTVTIQLTGTITAADVNNFQLQNNGTPVTTLPLATVAGGGPVTETYTLNVRRAAGSFTVNAIGAGGVAAVYTALIIATEVAP